MRSSHFILVSEIVLVMSNVMSPRSASCLMVCAAWMTGSVTGWDGGGSRWVDCCVVRVVVVVIVVIVSNAGCGGAVKWDCSRGSDWDGGVGKWDYNWGVK